MLRTEQNNSDVERDVIAAFDAEHGHTIVEAVFEHGQWWVIEITTGAAWSVCDANTPSGFCFEQVSRGDDE